MKVIHYSYDYRGADNFQRMIAAAERVAFELPEAFQLLVTDSPNPHEDKLPKKADYIKLPSRIESSNLGNHAPPPPSLPYHVIKSLCKTFIFDAIRCFKADVVLVQAPREIQREFFYDLNHFQRKPIEAKLVFGNDDLENAVMLGK